MKEEFIDTMNENKETIYENQYARVDRVPGKNKLAFDVIIKGSGKTALSVKTKINAIAYAKRLLDFAPLYAVRQKTKEYEK